MIYTTEPTGPKAPPMILMYHGVTGHGSSVPSNREAGADLYDVPLSSFEQQMAWLRDHHYIVGNLDQALMSVATSTRVLTFDDGEKNNFQLVLPVLQKYKFPAYFFITPQRINQPGYMDWLDLAKLRDVGMVIGSHGLTHQILLYLSDWELREELAKSKVMLEENLWIRVKDLSVPRGFCDARIIKIARDVGYKNIFVSDAQPSWGECYGRIAVKKKWTLKRFDLALQGKTPLEERIFGGIKNGFKTVFGARIYEGIRASLLGMLKGKK